FTSDQGAQAGPLPASLIDTIKQVDGVADAEGQIRARGALVANGKYAGSNTGAPSLVVSTLSDTFNPYSFSAGHTPQASGEVVVNSKLADDKHLQVGQHVQFATEVGLKPVTIVGIFKLGTASTIGGATIVGTTFGDAQQWFDRANETSTISVKVDPGVSQDELKRRFAAVGFGLPTAPIRLHPITIALPLGVGTVVAMLAAIGPAFRATRVPPIAALREGAELPPSALARHATLVSSLTGAAGLALIVDGVFDKGGGVHTVAGLGSTPSVLISMAVGAILCFLAV